MAGGPSSACFRAGDFPPSQVHFNLSTSQPTVINSHYSSNRGYVYDLLLLLMAVQEVLAMKLAAAPGELAHERGVLVAQLMASALSSALVFRHIGRGMEMSIPPRDTKGQSYLRCSFLL